MNEAKGGNVKRHLISLSLVFTVILPGTTIFAGGGQYTTADYLAARRQVDELQAAYNVAAANLAREEAAAKTAEANCYAETGNLGAAIAALEAEAKELAAQREANYNIEKQKWAALESEKNAYKVQKEILEAEYKRAKEASKKGKTAKERADASLRADVIKGELARADAQMRAKEAAIRAEIDELVSERETIKIAHNAKLAEIEEAKNQRKMKEADCKAIKERNNGRIEALQMSAGDFKRQLAAAEINLANIIRLCPECPGNLRPVVCGNGDVEPGEECDDGNRTNGDGCASNCRVERPPWFCELYPRYCPRCGDGIVDPGEECDDGNTANGDNCSSVCRIEPPSAVTCYACGMGDTCSPVTGAPAFCSTMFSTMSDCALECGDTPPPAEVTCYACGVTGCEEMTAPESICSVFYDTPACDDRCPVSIEPECGNGVLEDGEACDDGNSIAGDGCDALCRVEPDEPDRELCEDAILGVELPPGTRLRPFPDAMHVSVCETETTVRYLICGEDGIITVNVDACAAGAPCEDGACEDDAMPEPTCEDTDVTTEYPTGQNPDAMGVVSGILGNGRSYTSSDLCHTNGVQVYEYYCDGAISRQRIINCDAGERCAGGACVAGEAATPTCADTDVTAEHPDGQNPDMRGVVSGVYASGRSYNQSDGCHDNGVQVYEWYCDGAILGFRTINCDTGEHCAGGACIAGEAATPTCSDTDVTAEHPDGQNLDMRGVVSGIYASGRSYTLSDLCLDNGVQIYEHYCDGGIQRLRTIDCDDGERCLEGRCIAGCVCSRTPATLAEAGFVTDGACVVQHDICEGSTLVRFDCTPSGEAGVAERARCDSACRDGLCL